MFDHKNIQPQPDGLSTANTPTVMDRWEWRPHLHVEWEIESSECVRQLARRPHKHISPFCSCSNHVRAFLMRISTGSVSLWCVRVLRKWMKSKREGAAPDSADICFVSLNVAHSLRTSAQLCPRKVTSMTGYTLVSKQKCHCGEAIAKGVYLSLFLPSSLCKNRISWKLFPVLRLTLNVYSPLGGS